MVRRAGITFALALVAGCATGEGAETGDAAFAARRCNGEVGLCARRLSDVSFAATHNSFAVRGALSFLFVNQNLDLSAQLRTGIRGFMLDTYLHRGVPSLCHANCTLGGSPPLVPELRKLGDFLNADPNNVILLMLEEHSLSPLQFEGAMNAAGVRQRAYVHPSPSAPWPTLGELIDAGTNIVVFSETDPATRPTGEVVPSFYHYLWSHAWETPFHFSSVDDFSCEKNRGTSQTNQLYLVNHFVTFLGASQSSSGEANAWPLITGRTDECAALHRPNIVAVDFFDIADEPAPGGIPTVVAAVARLNAK